VLGQEQDSVGGDFDSSQSFQGMLSHVNLWDRVLPGVKIQEMSKSCGPDDQYDGNVYKWLDFLGQGGPKLVESPTCKSVKTGMAYVFNKIYTKYAQREIFLNAATLVCQNSLDSRTVQIRYRFCPNNECPSGGTGNIIHLLRSFPYINCYVLLHVSAIFGEKPSIICITRPLCCKCLTESKKVIQCIQVKLHKVMK